MARLYDHLGKGWNFFIFKKPFKRGNNKANKHSCSKYKQH